MKSAYLRLAVSGLIGSALVIGGLVAPLATPHVAADDETSVVLVVDDTDSGTLPATSDESDSSTPAQADTPTTDTSDAETGTDGLDPEPDFVDSAPIAPSKGTITLADEVTSGTGQQGVQNVSDSVVDPPSLTVAYPNSATITTKQSAVFDNVFTYDPLYDPESDDSQAGCSADVLPNRVGSGWEFIWGQFTFHSTVPGEYTATITCQDDIGQPSNSVINTITVVGPPSLTVANPATVTVLEGQTVEFDNVFTVDTTHGASSNGCTISPAVTGASVDNYGKVTFDATDHGSYDIRFTCTDSMGQKSPEVTNNVVVRMGGLKLDATSIELSGSSTQPMPGDDVTWNFAVTNDRTEDVISLSLDSGECVDSPLAAGATTTCQETTTLTRADIDAGVVKSVTQAHGTIGGETVYSDFVNQELKLSQVAALTAEKTFSFEDANGNGVVDVGEMIEFVITVRNTGNVTVHYQAVIDSWAALDLKCDKTPVLAADDTRTCKGLYEVTVDDVLAGDRLINTAYATALDPAGDWVQSEESQAVVKLNRPNAPILTDVTVTDPQPQGTPIEIDVKAVGYWDPHATYTPTVTVVGGSDVGTASLDVDTGWLTFIPNIAFSGQAAIEFTITDQIGQSDQATASLRVLARPVLNNQTLTSPIAQGSSVDIDIRPGSQLDEYASYDQAVDAVGGTASLNLTTGLLSFQADAGFTGRATIQFEITDKAGQSAGATVTIRVAGVPTLTANEADMTVLVGDTVQFTHQFVVDTANGASPVGCRISPAVTGATVDDRAVVLFDTTTTGDYSITVTCADSIGQVTRPVTHNVTVQEASLGLIVSAEQTTGEKDAPQPGDQITWTYRVTNSGQAPISDLAVAPGFDAVGTVTCIDDALDAGRSTVCTGTSLVTQADLDAGEVRDTGAQAFGLAQSDVEPRQVSSALVGASLDLPHPAASGDTSDTGSDDADHAETGGHILTVVPIVLLTLILLGLGTWLVLKTRRRMAAE